MGRAARADTDDADPDGRGRAVGARDKHRGRHD